MAKTKHLKVWGLYSVGQVYATGLVSRKEYGKLIEHIGFQISNNSNLNTT